MRSRARTIRRPSKRPLITALSACTSPLQEPVLPRMNFRHSIRPLSTIPSATSVPHDLSSPDNTISGPRKTSRTRFLLRRGFLVSVFVPASGHHLARTIGAILRPGRLCSERRGETARLCRRAAPRCSRKVLYRLRRNALTPTMGAKKARPMNSLGPHPLFSAAEIRRESIAHPSVHDALDSVNRGRETRERRPARFRCSPPDALIRPGLASFDPDKWVLVPGAECEQRSAHSIHI